MLNQGYAYREKLGVKARGKTSLAYLVEVYRHSSEAQWRERVERGEVLLNDQPAQGHELLQPGQVLCWNRPPWEEAETPRTFSVIYEDDSLVVVSKPSGLPTLPGAGYYRNTLLTLVQERFPGAVPVHRLGRGTSGLVLFTRTPSAAVRLSEAWRTHQVEKRYRALSQNRAEQDRYEITAPIGIVPHPLLKEVFAYNPKGKASRSTAQVLERREGQTLFQVDIHTGRPDQIRIHLAFIGHPLVGDSLYAAGGLPRLESPALPGEGGYLLHGERLVFNHPHSGERITLTAPVPGALL